MCPPMRAHWRHLANTIEPVLHLAHPGPQPKGKSVGSAIFAQLQQSVIRMPGHVLSANNCSFAWGIWGGPHLIHASLGPPKSITQTASWSVQLFLYTWPYSVPIFYNETPFPLKIAPSHGDLNPNLIHGSLVPPKWHLNRFSHFSRAHECDRPTDHAARSVTIGRYIRSTVMQHNNNDWGNIS